MDAGSLTRGQRVLFWACTLFSAAMRWPAKSLTLWDWDEALFALAVRDFDVSAYHPHPPGFPLFIALAKLIPLDEFHALQAVVIASALFVFPAMYLLARALRAPFDVAVGAGLLLAFLPNVWFFGGTALSDVPSMVLVVTACALLLRGNVILGCMVLALAAGFRPQNLLIGSVPFLLAFRRNWRAGLVGGALIAAVVGVTYGLAASFSGGWDAYRDVLASHEAYIRQTDSFLAPRHPGLLQVADDFFFRPFRALPINIVLAVLMVAAVFRRRYWLAVAVFGPFCLFAWLFLDFHSTSRFSIAYMPLVAMLAAAGIPRRGYAAVLGGVTALLIVWTWPALRVLHQTPSPPVAAMTTLPAGTVYVDERLAPHAALLLSSQAHQLVRVVPPFVVDPHALLIREGESTAPGSRNFTRERGRLEGIARKRYFEVSVVTGRRPG